MKEHFSYQLSEQVWHEIEPCLPGKRSDPGRSGENNRQFVEAVLWVMKNNARWNQLPEEYGQHKSIHKRYKRWRDKGVWNFVLSALRRDVDTGLPLCALTHQLGKITNGGNNPLDLNIPASRTKDYTVE